MPILLADLRTQLGYEDDQTDDDVALQDVLDAALEVVEGEVGPLSTSTYTETVTGSYGEALLSHYPVVSITSPVGLSFSRIGGVSGLPYYGTTEVVYVAGQEPTASQRMAVLLVAQDIWETRRGQGFPQDDTGQYVITPLLHRRVRELLAASRRGPSVA